MTKDPANAQREQAAYQEFLKMADQMLHKKPGIGLGVDTYDPTAGLAAERKRKWAEGRSAEERMELFKQVGLTNVNEMQEIFRRRQETPMQTFMRIGRTK